MSTKLDIIGNNPENQLILVKAIDFRLLFPQNSSVESSINDNIVYQKSPNEFAQKIAIE